MQQIQDSKMSMTITKQIQSSYEGFHSERDSNLGQQSNRQCSNLSDDHGEMSILCSIYHPVQHVLKALRLALRQKNFKGVEILDGSMLVVRMTWCDRLTKIFLCRDSPKYIVKLETREYTAQRILTLKSLDQNPNLGQMGDILQILKKAMPQPPILQQQEYKQDIYSLQATSTYMFHKILLNERYSIGKKMHTLIKHTRNHIENTQNLQPPPPLKIIQQIDSTKIDWINCGLNQIGNDMLQGFNCSRKQLVQILGFCRKTVQEYYYHYFLQQQANLIPNINYNNFSLFKKNSKILQLLPLTQKQFIKLNYCFSSSSILRQFYLMHHTFQLECSMLGYGEQQKRQFCKQLDVIYGKILNDKIKVINSTSYRQQYPQYLQEFLSG